MIKDTRQRLFEIMKSVNTIPINENNVSYLPKKEFLKEIDWGGDFADANASCLKPEAVVKWLNDELHRLKSNRGNKEKDKTKRGVGDMIVTQGNIEATQGETGDIEIDTFISNITKEPTNIFDSNPKAEKSDVGRPQFTVNTGLPAIVGIVYDKENQIGSESQFYSVTTCPGAGTCVVGCYARKAFYGMDDSKTMKLTRRLNFLLNDPKKYEMRAYAELLEKSTGIPDWQMLIIRWNDAGDFFAQKYFEIAKNITKRLLDDGRNVKSYAYTKRAEYVMELDDNDNFTVNFSTDANKIERDKISNWDGDANTKKSHRVPAYRTEKQPTKKNPDKVVKVPEWKHFFKRKGPHYLKDSNDKVIFATDSSKEELKTYIFEKYGSEFGFENDSLRYTWELPLEDEGGRIYNVIVLPSGDSDLSAQREDVRMSFLLEH